MAITLTLIACALLLGGFIFAYNSIVGLRQMTQNAWSDVDVYLKRRAELIPNLVAAVKAYASHEATVLEALATARGQALQVSGPTREKAVAEQEVGTRVVQALGIAEAYPELKASQNFTDLQRELTETEKLIANARRYYNACVRDLNTKIEAFPSSLAASVLGVKHENYFELDSVEEREAPTVAR